jgi:hypothetical protein
MSVQPSSEPQLSNSEKKDVDFELAIRFPPKAKGKGKAKAAAKAGSGNRAATPVAKVYDKDGNEKCKKFLNNNCNKGDNCDYSHKA